MLDLDRQHEIQVRSTNLCMNTRIPNL